MVADAGLLVVILAAYFVSRKRYGDVFTPLFVYVAVWCGCLFLFRLRFVNYDTLGPRVILVVGGSVLAFVVGCLTAGRPYQAKESSLQVALEPLEKAIRILDYLSITGLLFFLMRSALVFGLSAYLTDPDAIRLGYEDLGRVGALALLLSAIYPLFVCSLIHVLESRKLHWFTVVGLLLPAVQGFVTMSRNNLAVPLISGVFAWFYYRGWRSLNLTILRRFALAFALVVLYFIGVGFWYGKVATSEDYTLYRVKDVNVTSQVGLQLAFPYMYATGGFPTLQAAMEDVRTHLWGVRTLFPIARVFYGVGLLDDRPENASLEFYYVPVPFNTATYLFGFYEDFGIAGVIVCPFLLGFLSTRLYLEMKAGASIFSLGCTGVLMAVIVYSVFIGLASTVQVWYSVIALFVISRRCAAWSARKCPSALGVASPVRTQP